MAEIDSLARDFFSQKRFAVTGYSARGQSPANLIVKRLKGAGYEVFAVNPSMKEPREPFVFPALSAIPGPIDGVVIVNRPSTVTAIVKDCIKLGIPRIWMHDMLGTRRDGFLSRIGRRMTSVSDDAVREAEAKGISVISGGCPMQFLDPVDGGHKCIRFTLRLLGGYRD